MAEFSLTSKEKWKILKQAQSGNLELCENLRTKHPNFHWSILRYDTGDTILHCASRLGHLNTVKYLLSYTPSAINCKNNDDKTALHEAAQFSQLEIVKTLIDNGAEINALKRADWTPLMLACTKDNYNIVKLLIDKGALVNYQNKDGWTALHLISRQGNGEILKLLLNQGGDPGIKTNNGRSMLHVGALHGNVEIIKILLNQGLDVNLVDNCGNTPLHEAVLGRNIEICQILIDNGANINCRNNVDFNVLHLASSAGYDDFVQYLVKELKFDVNKSNSNGFTALHCAARKNHGNIYRILVNLGGDQELKDNFNRKASDYLNNFI